MRLILHIHHVESDRSCLKSVRAEAHEGSCRVWSPYPVYTRAHARLKDKANNPTSPFIVHARREVCHGR